MTREQILHHLTVWSAATAALDEQMDALAAIVGMQPESPLHEAVWRTWDHYTRTLADLIGAGGWLDWHYLENEMGARGYKCAPHRGAQLRAIDSIEALADLIHECNTHPGEHS